MSVQVEKLEKSMAKLTITVEAAKFDAAVDSAYQKNKGKIALPGFRKGKAPRAMIEKMYGTGVFFEDAANELKHMRQQLRKVSLRSLHSLKLK